MNPGILVTRRIYPEAIDYLAENCVVDYNGTDGILTEQEILERAKGKQAIVCQFTDKFHPGLIEQLEGIRVLANVAVGVDNIDVPAATRKGILVTNTPDVLTETTADMT